MKKQPKGSWIVRVRCDVEKDIVCTDCTEEEAGTNPYDHAVSEEEVQIYDCRVTDVTPND